MLHPTELGDKWAPAIPENEKHLESIENGNKNLSDIRSFYIGGSAKHSGGNGQIISYSSYFQDTSGTLLSYSKT